MEKSVKEYIQEGVKHYDYVIASLDSTSIRSPKYNYYRGAREALVNVLEYIRLQEEEFNERMSTTPTEESNSTLHPSIEDVRVSIEAVIPTAFTQGVEFYEYITAHPLDIVVERVPGKYSTVGTAEAGINGNIIYIKGEASKESVEAFNQMQFSALEGKPVLALSAGDTRNWKEVSGLQ